ncbi:MAG: nucleotidyltransferase substrate binding protein [Prevotellaceae bacterium]|jgi:nucleotidyltransferase substrate binding protein (TIGR01987 family)|nr:nucleotidyltransferase substrate binding protein [Prevotellaceae bacterium]
MTDQIYRLRWKQRFTNYQKALALLHEFTQIPTMNKYEKHGSIHIFETTYEMAWNLLKYYLTYQGLPGIIGPRDTIRYASRYGLISDGEKWMNMSHLRNTTSHRYTEQSANKASTAITDNYIPLLNTL